MEKEFMPIRRAEAEWKGNLIEGSGRLRVGSGAFDGPYSFQARVEDGGSATNPEEFDWQSPPSPVVSFNVRRKTDAYRYTTKGRNRKVDQRKTAWAERCCFPQPV